MYLYKNRKVVKMSTFRFQSLAFIWYIFQIKNILNIPLGRHQRSHLWWVN